MHIRINKNKTKKKKNNNNNNTNKKVIMKSKIKESTFFTAKQIKESNKTERERENINNPRLNSTFKLCLQLTTKTTTTTIFNC